MASASWVAVRSKIERIACRRSIGSQQSMPTIDVTPTPASVLNRVTRLLDPPPIGWFALDLMKSADGRKWDWCALMIDVHPDELKHCLCTTAWLYVHPDQ